MPSDPLEDAIRELDALRAELDKLQKARDRAPAKAAAQAKSGRRAARPKAPMKTAR
jgi:hypothetical protein